MLLGMAAGGGIMFCFPVARGLPANPVQAAPEASPSARELPLSSQQGMSTASQALPASPLPGTKSSAAAPAIAAGTARPLPIALPSSISTSPHGTRKGGELHAGKTAANLLAEQSANPVGARSGGMVPSSPVQSTTVAPSFSSAPVQNQPGSSEQVVELPLPAAFVPSPAGAPATTAQQAAVQSLQQQFNNAVAPYVQTASDTVYAQKWMTAQWQSDQMFKALMGQQAFLLRQQQANLQGGQSQP